MKINKTGEIMKKSEKQTFEWGVFIELHDSTGSQYEVMLGNAMCEILHDEIQKLLTSPETSKSKLLGGGHDLGIKW
tara:strand:- start:186 stop:413 length:228 start_codon:yes stop_codon:yes gene_type:complete